MGSSLIEYLLTCHVATGSLSPVTASPAPGLARWAAHAPDRVAVVTERERVTFAELDERVDALARWLRHTGASRSAPVLLALRTGLEAVESFLACGRAGVTCVPIPF